ncbi:TVG1053887 [Thermoplasma volcanium GSS1]|uniref:TVG1053887 protein n=1 Tax=Thermoplasma volcanium (strain ATCC 51530 / DSM 4299 / JCM 9571 / NBRC 15438 / GSS1) TaxID=273116 RepID=Q979Y1_THEVO|nr:hypothetical protein [Thermoplasma volcanium]BAB60171.1 TVG1053887 [Thermoplasma volcanium GSS1]
MTGTLPDNKQLIDIIIGALQKGEQSISSLGKILEENGHKMHRIMLSGYLKALVDVGILKERRIKPVALYSIAKKNDQDIYEIVGSVARGVKNSVDGDVALLLLYNVLKRPIFISEIDRCNVRRPTNFQYVSSDKRMDLIKKLAEAGIRISEADMLVRPNSQSDEFVLNVLVNFVESIIDLKKYTIPFNEKKQKTLD